MGEPKRSAPEFEVHPRVMTIMTEFLPKFRNLRAKFAPQEPPAPQSPGEDRRRIFASPTPQKADTRRSIRAASYASEIDGESVADSAMFSETRYSLGRRSFSVRSRSPPPQDPGSEAESLFQSCFSKRKGSSLACSEARRTEPPSTRMSATVPISVCSDEESEDID